MGMFVWTSIKHARLFHTSQAAKLKKEHVVALRLYTTAAFQVINEPLRELGRSADEPPHRLPVTVAILKEAIEKLRAVNAPPDQRDRSATRVDHCSRKHDLATDAASKSTSQHWGAIQKWTKHQTMAAQLLHQDPESCLSHAPSAVSLSSPSSPRTLVPDLWRGMHGVAVDEGSDFIKQGGTDYAPMSTSTSIKVALSYSKLHEPGAAPVLLRLRNRGWRPDDPSSGWMSHGVDLSFLSCFPAEEERVYPPLTYIKPINEQGRKAVQRIPVNIGRSGEGRRCIVVTVVSVVATFPT